MNPVCVIVPYSSAHTPDTLLDSAISSARRQSVETNIIVVEDKEGHGPAWARNKGLERSNSDLVAFLDADDRWLPNKLERQLAALKTHGVALCVEGDCDETSTAVELEPFISELLFGDMGSLTSTILLDRRRAPNVQFDESLNLFEDHLFMIQAAVAGGVCFCDGPLAEIEKHDKGLSARSDPEQLFESRLAVAERLEGEPTTEQFVERLRHLAYYGLGRQHQLQGSPVAGVRPLLKSLWYRPAIKPLAAVALTPYYLVT